MGYVPAVGEMVRIRQFDDMKGEYGMEDDYIKCTFGFYDYMRSICGTSFVVTEVRDDMMVLGHDTGFSISVDMIEPVEEFEIDTDQLNEFLGSYCVQ